jgi:hypothetical protein
MTRWLTRRSLGTAALVAGGTYVLVLFLTTVGWRAAFPVVLAVVIAVIAVVATARSIETEPIPDSIHETPWLVPSFPEADDGVETSVARWISRIDFGSEELLHGTIVALIDERLKLEHGIDRAASPALAKDVVGPELWRFITETRHRRHQPDELTKLIARMEAL